MRSARVVGLTLLALVLAIVPGGLRFVPTSAPLARAPLAPTDLQPNLVGLEAPAPPPVVEVPIIPPPADLSGPMAPASTLAAPFKSAGTPVEGEVLALVVGIDDYPGRRADLTAAVADADAIDAALAGFGVPAGNRVVLRDGQARRDGVIAAINALVERAGEGSTVVFAYAGHVRKIGFGREALVTADGGLITDEELAVLLAPSAAQRMWLLLATCFAGGFTEALAPGRILTGAAGANELAYESPDLSASFLIHHLIHEGWLEGRAGPSVQEAFAYADARIAERRSERRPVQIDALGMPLTLGSGDPSAGHRLATEPAPSSQPASAPPPQEQAPPPTTQPPPPPPNRDDERTCTLGVLLCRKP